MLYIKKHPFYEDIYVEKHGDLIFKMDEYGNLRELKIRRYKPYYRKTVYIEGKTRLVHHVVYETYHEEKWDKSIYDIDHIDCNSNNNAASNLRKLTISVNRGRGYKTPEEYLELKKQWEDIRKLINLPREGKLTYDEIFQISKEMERIRKERGN